VAAVERIIGPVIAAVQARSYVAACAPGVGTVPGGRASYNRDLCPPDPSMEAERLNQLDTTLAGLRARLAELRRYL
jgi:hypothetical protein